MQNGTTLFLMRLIIAVLSIGRSNHFSVRDESLSEMQVDKVHFPINVVEKEDPAILIRSEQADITIGKNVIYR